MSRIGTACSHMVGRKQGRRRQQGGDTVLLGRAQNLCGRLREQGGDIRFTRQSCIPRVGAGIGVVSKNVPASRCIGLVNVGEPPRHRASGHRWGDGCPDAGDVANKPRTRGETRQDARPINVPLAGSRGGVFEMYRQYQAARSTML